ncbi:MAG: hypothetical protein A2057_13810 [Ignavibacteria bacterium GWA2_35_9]|nr:MAG: hypothetical protein A2057_13810 [Ignavibacteria bacterium GWA2_35_9]OGU47302.1 MAG: hypothetical protein A2000_04155 [Ignavibacteria bacterium GWB2_36_8]OGU52072.1 MAG: hypothetical protein A2080_02570 [Ignavibacteria bacterium GWC2_36_12]
MPFLVATAVRHIASNVLPYRTQLIEQNQKITEDEKELLQIGIIIGFDMVYNAVVRLGNIKIADEGAQILWQVLCYTNKNNIKDIKKMVIEEFESAEKAALHANDKYSATLIAMYKKHGLSGEQKLPSYPEELIEKLM